MLRRTKILTTLGPATDNPKVLADMIRAGADVVRVNFSHGEPQAHAKRVEMVRSVGEQVGKWVAVLGDLQGPKIRIGRIAGGEVELGEGETVRIVNSTENPGTRELLTTTYRELPHDVAPGDRILLDDGRLVLEVEEIENEQIVRSHVLEGGLLMERKGINLPGVAISTAALTDKDREDIRFGCEHGVDFVALSFVRSGEDIDALKAEIRAAGGGPQVIAKLEKPRRSRTSTRSSIGRPA